jgi:hypothetical protein
MCKEMPDIQVNMVVNKKIIIGKIEGQGKNNLLIEH